MKVTDEMLYQNAAAARDIWLGTLPSDGEIPEHKFSKDFEQKMKKLIKNQRRPGWVQISLLYLKRAAAVAMIALVVTAVGVMSVDAYRERVLQVVTQVFHEFTSYRFYTEGSDGYAQLPEVEFTYIPEGFELVESSVRETRAYYLYENTDGKFFELNELLVQANGDYGMILDTEDSQMEQFCIGDSEAICNTKGSDTIVMWSNENIRLDVYGNIGVEEVKLIAQGVKLIAPIKSSHSVEEHPTQTVNNGSLNPSDLGDAVIASSSTTTVIITENK